MTATFAYVDSSLPIGMTLAEYRRARTAGTNRRRRRRRLKINLRAAARQGTAATA